jgi:hypothetical protein
MINSCLARLGLFAIDRHSALRRLLIVSLLGIGVSAQSCGGEGAVNTVAPTLNPVGTAIGLKEVFSGNSAGAVLGTVGGEFLPKVSYGGSLIKSQANLDLYWTHPVFSLAAKPVVDFTNQTIVVYTAVTRPGSKVLIERVSSSQAIVLHCQTTGFVGAYDVYFVSMKLIDIVIDGSPKFEVRNERADFC